MAVPGALIQNKWARCVTQQAVLHWLTGSGQLVLFQFILCPVNCLPVYQSLLVNGGHTYPRLPRWRVTPAAVNV